jgi:hypothetical protein
VSLLLAGRDTTGAALSLALFDTPWG